MFLKYISIPFCLICIFLYGQQCRQAGNKESALNPDFNLIRTTLEELYDRDQKIREILMDSIGYNSPEASIYISKIIKIDSQNQEVLLPIIEKYGWIPRSKIGYKASDGIFAVIQHSNPELMNKYFPQLDSLARMNEASTVDAAKMEDRILLYKGQKQKYGTQATIRQDKSKVIWPIEDPAKVDSLRKAAGFELTVYENAQRLGAIYDRNEKLPNNK